MRCVHSAIVVLAPSRTLLTGQKGVSRTSARPGASF